MDNYKRVINILIQYYGISREEFCELLKKKENKYLLLLLLKEFKCLNKEKIKEESIVFSYRSIIYNLKKAEEKLLINKSFREDYFSLQENIEKTLKKP